MTGKGWVIRRMAWWVLPSVDEPIGPSGPGLAGQMDQGPSAKAWDQGRSLESPEERHSCAEGVKSPFSGTAWERITVAVKQLAFGAKVSLWNVPGMRSKGWEALTPRSCLLNRWDAPGSRPSGNFPQGHPREPHGALRLGPKLADPSAGPSRPPCPTGPLAQLAPRVVCPGSQRPSAGAWSG